MNTMSSPPMGLVATYADDYARLKHAIAGLPLPLAVLDIDRLETNAMAMLKRAGSLPIRLGTKSIRCVEVLKRVQRLSPMFQGLLCYSGREAAWLSTLGFKDLLIAYPSVESADIDAVAARTAGGAKITLMVDEPAQLEVLAARARLQGVKLRVCIDLDCSTEEPGLYFGVRRSPIRTPAAAVALAQAIATSGDALQLVGLMGYEAQIAGLQDAVPGQAMRNVLVGWLKRRSMRTLAARRQATVAALKAAGHTLEFVNGGGTGSLEATAADASVTELAAGSGLYAPGLFDHFKQFRHLPALGFALPIVRMPAPGYATCSGGGYIASGPTGADRSPQLWLPKGAQLLPLEGAGEVQTPVKLPPGFEPKLGDPLFFRHAKAGELAERFERFVLLQGDQVIGDAATYRGLGKTFF